MRRLGVIRRPLHTPRPMTTVEVGHRVRRNPVQGWAAQPGLRTVQGELEAGLETVLREPVELTVAGRTDTGVHALGQVASFDTRGRGPPSDLARRLNGIGPNDIAVTAATVVADGFDARHDARSRTYRYRVLARQSPSPFEQGRALWWPHRIDREALEACAEALQGTHDFTAFTPTQTDHVHFDRRRPPGWVGSRKRRHPRLPHHRRRLHAKHGPRPRRHDARNGCIPPHRRELPEAPTRAPPAPRPATRPHPTACTSKSGLLD